MRFFRRMNDLFSRCIRISVGNIFCNRRGFQPGLLKYHSIIFSQAIPCNMPDILTFHTDNPCIYIIETHEKIDESRLSASCRTDNRNLLPRLYVQIQIFQKRYFFLIRKAYVFQIQVSFCIYQYHGVLIIFRLRFFFDKSNTLLSQASAFWSSVTTPEISLNGWYTDLHSSGSWSAVPQSYRP